MQQWRVLCVLIAVVVTISVAGATAVAAAQPSTAAQPTAEQPASIVAQQEEVEADDIRITITLTEDGAAEWAVSFRSVLDTEERREAFAELQADIEADPESYTAPFADRIDNTVATASNATDREMQAESFSVDAEQQSLAREYGVVTYRFRWAGFADTQNGELHAGDAISGFFLDEDTQLRIEWPENYELRSVEPVPTAEHTNAVSWDGSQIDFVPGEPRVVVGPAGLPIGMLLGGGVALAALIVGGWLWLRRQAADDSQASVTSTVDDAEDADGDNDANDADDDKDADDSAGRADGAEAADNADDKDAADTTATAATDPTAAASDASAAEGSPDQSLLSNEEQVLQLLDENGGRIKQKQVVETLGWTDAKTSKVVSGLREEGTIESFRIGRENVLRYPDRDEKDK